MLSQRCIYGIQASIYVAATKTEDYVPVREISEALGLSHAFMAKVTQHLTQTGIMRSLRGPRGGVALRGDAREVSLHQVILALDGPGLFDGCLLGFAACGKQHACPIGCNDACLRDGLHAALAETSIRLLADRFRSGRLLLGHGLMHTEI